MQQVSNLSSSNQERDRCYTLKTTYIDAKRQSTIGRRHRRHRTCTRGDLRIAANWFTAGGRCSGYQRQQTGYRSAVAGRLCHLTTCLVGKAFSSLTNASNVRFLKDALRASAAQLAKEGRSADKIPMSRVILPLATQY